MEPNKNHVQKRKTESIKIYIYTLPSFASLVHAPGTCNYWEQRLWSTIKAQGQFTSNPSEADFFFVPMHCLVPNDLNKSEIVEAAILQSLRAIGSYWDDAPERHIISRDMCPPKNRMMNNGWTNGPLNLFRVTRFKQLYLSKAIVMCVAAVACPDERDMYRQLM